MSKELKNAQGSDGWHSDRLAHASASHAHEILSSNSTLGYRKYRAQLVMEAVTGKKTETYSNDYMDTGTENEPVARLLYSMKTGHAVRESGFWVHDKIKAGASPDGVVDDKFGIEIKTQLPHIHLMALIDKFIDPKYQKQMDFQMWITGFPYMDFVSYSPLVEDDTINLSIIRYNRDEERIGEIENQTKILLKDVGVYNDKLEKLRNA